MVVFPLASYLLISAFAYLLFLGGTDLLQFRAGGVKAISARGFRPLRAASAAGVDEIGVVATVEGRRNSGPIIVIDNYDSFTYNLCQVLCLWCVLYLPVTHR